MRGIPISESEWPLSESEWPPAANCNKCVRAPETCDYVLTATRTRDGKVTHCYGYAEPEPKRVTCGECRWFKEMEPRNGERGGLCMVGRHSTHIGSGACVSSYRPRLTDRERRILEAAVEASAVMTCRDGTMAINIHFCKQHGFHSLASLLQAIAEAGE